MNRRALITAIVAIAGWTLSFGTAPTIAAPAPAPFDLTLEFEFAAAAGEEGVREELELQLLSEMRRVGCFRSAELDADDETASELRLRVRLIEFHEETSFDVPTAYRTGQGATPDTALAHTARFRSIVDVTLEQPDSGRTLRSKRIQGNGTHRPLYHGDDARSTARMAAVMETVRGVRTFACKGGAKRLKKELARAE